MLLANPDVLIINNTEFQPETRPIHSRACNFYDQILLVEKMNKTMRREYVETFYRSCGTTINIEDSDDIFSFLSNDLFSLGIQPSQALRGLRVGLRVDLLLHKHIDMKQSAHAELSPDIVLFHQIARNLSYLKNIHFKMGFKLDLDIKTAEYFFLEHLALSLETIAPTLKQLKVLGFKIRARVEHWHTIVGCHDIMGELECSGPEWWDDLDLLKSSVHKLVKMRLQYPLGKRGLSSERAYASTIAKKRGIVIQIPMGDTRLHS